MPQLVPLITSFFPTREEKDSTQRSQSKTCEITEEKTKCNLCDLCKNFVTSVLKSVSSSATVPPCARIP